MNGYTKRELCLIWLDSFIGLEYKHKQTLINIAGQSLDAKSIVEKGKDYILNSLSANVYSTLKNSLNVEYMQSVLTNLEKSGVRVLTIYSDGYPESLKNTKIPPLALYAKGNLELLKEKNLFAIVGSRKSLPLSLGITKDYTESLIKAGVVPVTGIAEGVDETVIKTSLANGGKVISVIAGGFNNVYPKANLKLVEEVAKNGLVLSESTLEVAPMPYMFPVRNRIFAGLSKGVLVVSAGKKSGTLWTAEYALEYGKDVFAIPYSVGVASGEGCNNLIKQGATLTDNPQDIINFYGLQTKQQKMQFTQEEKSIIDVLSNGELHINQISATLHKRAFEITPLLSVMEIKGYIIKSGNVYQLTRSYSED